MAGAWARLVCSNETEEHLALCEEAMKEIQEEVLRRCIKVPDRGRFIVHDGKVYRVTDMWLEQGPNSASQEKWGVVVRKEEHS